MKNLVLIGMPGSGKTKMGQLLARRFALPLLDTDAMVEAAAGMPIPQIFERFGEGRFRDMESQAALQAAQVRGAVVATGGGMVLRQANMDALARTGVIFFRDRPPQAILGEDHKGRPLLAQDAQRVFQLYEERLGLYKRYAHHYIAPTETYQEAAEQIAAIFEKEAQEP